MANEVEIGINLPPLIDDYIAGNLGGGGGGSGSVTSVSGTGTQGVTVSIVNPTTAPAITVGLGAITPTSIVASGNVAGANLSGTNTGDQTTITGNAGTATKLQTARTINGVAFDGTGNITINAVDSTARQPLDGDLTSLAGQTATGVLVYRSASETWTPVTIGSNLTFASGTLSASGGGGSGTVTSVSVTTANGVSGTVANASTTPAITLSLGAITPSSIAATGTITGSNLSGTNTGDQTSVTGNAGTATKWQTARTFAYTGDATGSVTGVDGSANVSTALALATSGVTAGTYGSSTQVPQIQVDAKGRVLSASNVAISGGSGATTVSVREQTFTLYESVSGGSWRRAWYAPSAQTVTVRAIGGNILYNVNSGGDVGIVNGATASVALAAGDVLMLRINGAGSGLILAHVTGPVSSIASTIQFNSLSGDASLRYSTALEPQTIASATAFGPATYTYAKNTVGAPGTFTTSSLPITLAAGETLRVTPASVTADSGVALRVTA